MELFVSRVSHPTSYFCRNPASLKSFLVATTHTANILAEIPTSGGLRSTSPLNQEFTWVPAKPGTCHVAHLSFLDASLRLLYARRLDGTHIAGRTSTPDRSNRSHHDADRSSHDPADLPITVLTGLDIGGRRNQNQAKNDNK
jgi:hypothetical protein